MAISSHDRLGSVRSLGDLSGSRKSPIRWRVSGVDRFSFYQGDNGGIMAAPQAATGRIRLYLASGATAPWVI